jgi:hypothetical protein
MTSRQTAAPRTFSEVISQNLMHDHSSKYVLYGNGKQQEKGEEESMNVSEINSSQEGMEEVHKNLFGEQEKADSRSGSAVTTEETHQVTGTMVRGRTQASKTFFGNTNSQRNEIMVLIPEEDVLFNSVSSNIPKWRPFKRLRWMQNLHQSTWDHDILYTDRSSKDEQLLKIPLLSKKIKTNMAAI